MVRLVTRTPLQSTTQICTFAGVGCMCTAWRVPCAQLLEHVQVVYASIISLCPPFGDAGSESPPWCRGQAIAHAKSRYTKGTQFTMQLIMSYLQCACTEMYMLRLILEVQHTQHLGQLLGKWQTHGCQLCTCWMTPDVLVCPSISSLDGRRVDTCVHICSCCSNLTNWVWMVSTGTGLLHVLGHEHLTSANIGGKLM
jgi:hypothetical protein